MIDESQTPSAFRRYAPRAVLVLAIALAAAVAAPAIPEDQTVVFRRASDRVKSMSATFTRNGDDEPMGGVRLSFEGHAPSEVRHEVALPNGDYLVSIDVAGEPSSAAQTSLARRVTLQGGVTTVFVESGQP